MLSLSDLGRFHRLCSDHKDAVTNSKICGCFCCCRTFNPKDIREWIDKGTTAICPKCGVDSVLPESDLYNVSDKKFLRDMEDYWFGISKMVKKMKRKKK